MKTKFKTNECHSILKRLREMDHEPEADSIAGENLFEIRRNILTKLRLRVAKQRLCGESISPVHI